MSDLPASIAVSVIVPTYNRVDRLRRVLDALALQDFAEPFEVIVVSDGSTDGTNAFLTESTFSIPLTTIIQENSGPAAARNAAIAAAQGTLLLFVDDDVVATPALLRHHVHAHAANPGDIVVIGPMLTPEDGRLSSWVAWEQHMLYKQYRGLAAGEWEPTSRQFYTGNASVPRRCVEAVGGFDTTLRRAEDIELATRLSRAGLHFVFDPDARAFHYADRSFQNWLQIATDYGRNDVRFARTGRGLPLSQIALEFGWRNPLQRILIRTVLPRPNLATLVGRVLTRSVTIADRLHLRRAGRQVLSGLYGMTYYRGVADELGSVDDLMTLLRDRRLPERDPS